MATKHSPAPWEKEDSDMLGEYLIYPADLNAGHIAEVHGENAEANADMMVAAPTLQARIDSLREFTRSQQSHVDRLEAEKAELVETLKRASQYVRHYISTTPETHKSRQETLEQIETALTKAQP